MTGPAERWEAADDGRDCVVVIAGTATCVAVMGDPMEDPTADDWRRLPLVIAAPELRDSLQALLSPMLAALDDGVRLDPEAHAKAIGAASRLLRRLEPRRAQMDNPLDGRGVGL